MSRTNLHLQNSLRMTSMNVDGNKTTQCGQEKETAARKETALNWLNVQTDRKKPTSKFPGTKYTRAKEACVRTYLQSSVRARKKMTLPYRERKEERILYNLDIDMAELNQDLEDMTISSYMDFSRRVPYPCVFSSNEMMPEGSTKSRTPSDENIQSPNPTASGGTIQSPCPTPSDGIINIGTSIYTPFPGTDFGSEQLSGGLPNFGNNCYVNASLQCLFTAESFCRELSNLVDSSTHTLEYLFLRCFVELLRLRNSSDVQDDDNTSLFLLFLMKSAAHYNPEFTIDIQNDAHEFLCYCLTQVEESGQKLGWQEDVNPRCPVTSNFKFKMWNIITCSSCGSQQNNNVEVFNHVSVPLKHDSVDQCLSDVVNLNRFRMTENYTVEKVKTPVDITPELQINCFPQSHTPGIENSRSEARETDRNALGGSTSTYRLISVLSHIGSTACYGHYVSDCSSHDSLQWKIYDDDLVRLTSEMDMLERRSTSAYVLLYERVRTG
ncbi:hypothetical protein AMELA_G00059460 [Ameiurus melas]|uniref:Ubiquitin carboxyl-terminal hydrolase n=1 Tax=Ameiurus melas TaxID=219545 RepID=A0A7J6B544_AMEME|nr:hypothetical protein AMELA_G00059460 [Ameiurus melas]